MAKEIEMHLWADHGGRPIPEELTHKVVVQPWQYHILAAEQLKSQVVKYAGADKTSFMMGAGASFIHEHGVFSATKLWCRAAKDAPNCRGVTICLWGTNDVGGRLISLFGGADYAWTPDSPADRENDAGDEWTRGVIARRMKHWQAHFADGDPHMLEIERGPEALMGRYVWPPRAGEPVGPTADWEQKKTP